MLTKIVLSGAPGSGKTALANEIASAQEARGDMPVAIIDNYNVDVEQRTDMATGSAAGYLADVAVAIERYGQERKAISEGARTIIICGSIADTAAHAALNSEIAQSQFAYEAARITMPMFGAIRASLGEPLTYFLPTPEEEERVYARALDIQIPLALEALSIDYRELEGPSEFWAASILEDIIAYQKEEEE